MNYIGHLQGPLDTGWTAIKSAGHSGWTHIKFAGNYVYKLNFRERIIDVAMLIAGIVLFVLNPITFGFGILVGYTCSGDNLTALTNRIERFTIRKGDFWGDGMLPKFSITPVISFFLFVACLPYSIALTHIYCSLKLGQYVYKRDQPPVNKFDII